MTKRKKSCYFLDLRTDYGFKRVFDENKELLMDMLNEFLHEVIGKRITDVVYLPTEQLGFTLKEKRIIFDLYSEDQSLNRIIIEMQRSGQDYYENRTLYYMGRSISKSVRRGDREYKMEMTISLHLLDYKNDWFKDNDDVVHVIRLTDEKNRIFSKKVAIVLVNLCIFAGRKKAVGLSEKRRKWVYLLKNMHRMTLEDEMKENDPTFKKLYEASRLSNLNEEEMREYKKSVLEYQDVQDAIKYASRRNFEEGEKRGEARGREAGLADAKRTMALEMLKKGIPLSLASDITGLSEKEVRQLTVDFGLQDYRMRG